MKVKVLKDAKIAIDMRKQRVISAKKDDVITVENLDSVNRLIEFGYVTELNEGKEIEMEKELKEDKKKTKELKEDKKKTK